MANIKRMIRGEEPEPMHPWFKGFTGTIVPVDSQKYIVNGEVSLLDETTIEITELPIKTWTGPYKEQVLEPMLHGSSTGEGKARKEIQPSITDFKEYHTDQTVK